MVRNGAVEDAGRLPDEATTQQVTGDSAVIGAAEVGSALERAAASR